MRLIDDRYTRERQQLELALRMLRYEARSCMIRACTGISEDRIRKLYNTYIESDALTSQRRKRGKAPRELSSFLRNGRAQMEASILAGVLSSLELVDRDLNRDDWRPSMRFAERFCDGFDFYRQLVEEPKFTFEHAWYLMLALARGDELQLAGCAHCGAVNLRDALTVVQRPCPFCRK